MTAPIHGATSFAATLQRADATRPDLGATRASSAEAPRADSLGADAPRAPGGVDFAERVRELVDDANAQQVRAEAAAEAYANGERNDLHGTMIALEQADITFRLVSNVRSRLVEAYREVMRMGT